MTWPLNCVVRRLSRTNPDALCSCFCPGTSNICCSTCCYIFALLKPRSAAPAYIYLCLPVMMQTAKLADTSLTSAYVRCCFWRPPPPSKLLHPDFPGYLTTIWTCQCFWQKASWQVTTTQTVQMFYWFVAWNIPPWCRVGPLSLPESEAMFSYIKESLARHFNCKSFP